MLQRPDRPQRLDPRDRLIVALDFSSVAEARAMVTRLGDTVSFYKIGYQLGFADGIGFSRELIDGGKQLFIDLKLHDIGNTVAQGVKSVSRLGATFLTVHAYPQTMQAAVDAREGCLRILGVTVLTSSDDSDLANAGYMRIVVLTQYKSHSLDLHISRTWRLSTLLGDYVTPVPAQMRRGPRWFRCVFEVERLSLERLTRFDAPSTAAFL